MRCWIFNQNVIGEKGGSYSVSLDWVVERVNFFCQVVELSCEDYDDQICN